MGRPGIFRLPVFPGCQVLPYDVGAQSHSIALFLSELNRSSLPHLRRYRAYPQCFGKFCIPQPVPDCYFADQTKLSVFPECHRFAVPRLTPTYQKGDWYTIRDSNPTPLQYTMCTGGLQRTFLKLRQNMVHICAPQCITTGL